MIYKFIPFYICCAFLSRVLGFNLTILHTNDVHARYNETNKYSGQCTSDSCYGGAARQKTIIDQIRAGNGNTLLLDAGDQFQGTLWFSHYGGVIASTFMNELGYNVMALGNHEFDRGIDGIMDFLRNTSFTVLSCNINTTAVPRIAPFVGKHHVIMIGGERVGVIGYTTKDTPMISNPGSLPFLDEVTSIRREVAALKSKGVNKIIALGHAGFSVDKRIASEVEDIDIVVGGHTNTFLYSGSGPSNEKPVGTYPHVVTHANGNTVLVVQDYAFGKYMGFLQVEFDDSGRVVSYGGNPILLDSSVNKDPSVQAIIDDLGQEVIATTTQVIGRTEVYLEGNRDVCRKQECNLGNMVADSLVYENIRNADNMNSTRVFISLVNSGSIRASISKGTITIGNAIEVQPFRNTVDTIKLQGRYLREALEHSVHGLDPQSTDLAGKFLQVSGLRVKYDLGRKNGDRVVDVKALCGDCDIPRYMELDDGQIYSMLLSNFILNGGDGYSMIKENAVQDVIVGSLDTDIFTSYITNRSPIFTPLENRIEFVTSTNSCPTSRAVRTFSRVDEMLLLLLLLVPLALLIPL